MPDVRMISISWFRLPCLISPTFLVFLMTALISSALTSQAGPRASTFILENGMQVVVIPDTRAPVVTHMVWYRIGAADEPVSKSGIAHFLEHLMFKSTEKIAVGEFSKIVAKLGGQDNAFTSQDVTAYHQRIARERLQDMMAMEADRMVNLRLTEKEVLTERDVILEERRSRVENNPSSILAEQMDAALYMAHPYGIPVIGWAHEIALLDRNDALTFYNHFYAPNNAILVVAGDVTVDEVREKAEATYGKIPANPAVTTKRSRPKEPPHRVPVHVELQDPRAGKASLTRYYLTTGYNTDTNGEAEALEVMVKILASGATGRLYKSLVMDGKLASNAGGWYYGSSMDDGKVGFYAVAADGTGLSAIEAGIDKEIERIQNEGVTDAELTRAKNSLIADHIYQSDNQASLARRYGFALSIGQTIEDVEAWPNRIRSVTADSVRAAAKKFLDIRYSVTGYLIPSSADNDNVQAPAAPRG